MDKSTWPSERGEPKIAAPVVVAQDGGCACDACHATSQAPHQWPQHKSIRRPSVHQGDIAGFAHSMRARHVEMRGAYGGVAVSSTVASSHGTLSLTSTRARSLAASSLGKAGGAAPPDQSKLRCLPPSMPYLGTGFPARCQPEKLDSQEGSLTYPNLLQLILLPRQPPPFAPRLLEAVPVQRVSAVLPIRQLRSRRECRSHSPPCPHIALLCLPRLLQFLQHLFMPS